MQPVFLHLPRVQDQVRQLPAAPLPAVVVVPQPQFSTILTTPCLKPRFLSRQWIKLRNSMLLLPTVWAPGTMRRPLWPLQQQQQERRLQPRLRRHRRYY